MRDPFQMVHRDVGPNRHGFARPGCCERCLAFQAAKRRPAAPASDRRLPADGVVQDAFRLAAPPIVLPLPTRSLVPPSIHRPKLSSATFCRNTCRDRPRTLAGLAPSHANRFTCSTISATTSEVTRQPPSPNRIHVKKQVLSEAATPQIRSAPGEFTTSKAPRLETGMNDTATGILDPGVDRKGTVEKRKRSKSYPLGSARAGDHEPGGSPASRCRS